jgi:hypothetical protein
MPLEIAAAAFPQLDHTQTAKRPEVIQSVAEAKTNLEKISAETRDSDLQECIAQATIIIDVCLNSLTCADGVPTPLK